MYSGISLEVDQSQFCLLKELLTPIRPEKYCWYRPIDQEEVWSRPGEVPFFEKDIYSGTELRQLITSDHFVVFLRLEAYFTSDDISHLVTFEDYVHSPCQLVLLIWDCEQVAFYIKDEELLKTLFLHLKDKFENVKLFNDKNDSRTGLKIL